MTTTVPLSALATSLEDIDAPLTRKFLFPQDDVEIHRKIEYLWGLEIYSIDPTHERSLLHVRNSMLPLLGRTGGWTLVPTEETLVAMQALQSRNIAAPVSKRKSFLTEFSATEYEYIVVPLSTEIDFFSSASRRNTAAVQLSLSIQHFDISISKPWRWAFLLLTAHWYPSANLPEDFLRSCYPATLYTLSESDSEPEAGGLESKSGSDETVVTPMDEDVPGHFPPDKEEFVSDWVRWDASHSHECVVPTAPTVSRDQGKKLLHTLLAGPRWNVESTRGQERFKKLLAEMQSSPPATEVS
ncbi:hypothetical protein B0H14DRAFT_3717524 [Mycena olivaceomarginata]|nr:hypothetical protein B0H14DRAFT_3717524 [Mycena olivaceomarginata]